MIRLLCLAALLPYGAENNGAESLEWLAYDCDAIVRGKVLSTREASRDGDTYLALITIRVAETFKGARTEELSFCGLFWDSEGWTKDDVERLFFLVKAERYLKNPSEKHKAHASAGLALRSHGWTQRLALRLDGNLKTGLFDAEFREHKEGAAILDALRRAVSSLQAGMPASVDLDAPSDSAAHRALWAGSSVWIKVPLDTSMKKRARTWLIEGGSERVHAGAQVLDRLKDADDPAWFEEHLPRAKGPDFKLLALRAFQAQRTDKRVGLVKTLLADPYVDLRYEVVDGRQIPVAYVYPVRREAWGLLQAWGVEVPPPVLEKPYP